MVKRVALEPNYVIFFFVCGVEEHHDAVGSQRVFVSVIHQFTVNWQLVKTHSVEFEMVSWIWMK